MRNIFRFVYVALGCVAVALPVGCAAKKEVHQHYHSGGGERKVVEVHRVPEREVVAGERTEVKVKTYDTEHEVHEREIEHADDDD